MVKEILLLSSGIDSLIAWYYLGKPPCLHISGHSRYSPTELLTIERLEIEHSEMKITIIEEMKWLRQFEEEDANIPARNALFCLIASYYGDKIYLVCQKGEQSIPDRSPKFAETTSDYLSRLHDITKEVNLVFYNMTKQDMVHWFLSNELPKDELLSSYSCFSNTGKRCGKCPACARTAIALDYNHILPDNYFESNIWKWEGWKKYALDIKNGKYNQERSEQWIKILLSRNILTTL